MKNNQSKNKKSILETIYDTIMEKGGVIDKLLGRIWVGIMMFV